MKKLFYLITFISSFGFSQNNGLLATLLQEQAQSSEIVTPTSTDFITSWETTTASETVIIPLSDSSTYDITVTWGDGSPDETFTGLGSLGLSHVYTTAGTYLITFSPNVVDGWRGLFFNNTGDKDKLKDISQWGDSAITVLNYYGCNTLTGTATDVPNLTNITSMSAAFRNCDALTFTNWSSWTPTNVTTYSNCFRDSNINGGDASWITSTTTSIQAMYLNNDGFNQNWASADISSINNYTLFNLNGDGWSTANYDATLIGWAAQTPLSGETFDAGNVNRTSASSSAYTTLTTTYTMTINDNGQI